jgi:thiol-disulfide isomerase/thioredoxin
MIPKNYRLPLAILLVVVLIGVAYLVYRTYKVEKFEETAKKVKIVLVHASWCPHCTDYLDSGVWGRSGDKIMANPEFAGRVQFSDIEYEANKAAVEKYGVSGFPSIIAVNEKDEKILDFNSFRESPKPNRMNVDDIEAFAKAALDL